MTILQLDGYIDEQGSLRIDLPPDLPPGKVRVVIELGATGEAGASWHEHPWTPDEIHELLQFKPKTGVEIAQSGLIGAWADQGIMDSVMWVKEVRRREQERHG